jgi:hypothetical protein
MSKTKTVTVRVTEDFRKRADVMREEYFAQMPMNTFMAYLAGIGLRAEEERFSGNSGGKMYRDGISEEEAYDDFNDLLEKVMPMNPDITDWSKFTEIRSTSGMVEVRDRLIKAIKDGIINGPKEDIPVSLKDLENEIKKIQEELEDYKDEREQKSRNDPTEAEKAQ